METILTVLSTLGVGALAYAFAGVIRLSRRVNDLELIRMELVDLEGRFERQLEREVQDRESLEQHTNQTFGELNASIDRRTDKLWEEYHNLNGRVKTLDKTINPNKDLIKGLTK